MRESEFPVHNEKLVFTKKYFVKSTLALVKLLLSRNFCQNCAHLGKISQEVTKELISREKINSMRENVAIFHTVRAALRELKKYDFGSFLLGRIIDLEYF